MREKQMLIVKSKKLVYFVFWPTGGGGWTAGSVIPVDFFDFMTIATMRCSSIRKARTILKTIFF
jgi:hypothetical protein